MGYFFVFNRKKKYIDTVLDHRVYDLIKAVKFINLLSFSPCGNLYDKSINYKYYPIFNEIVVIVTLFRSIVFTIKNKNNQLKKFKILKNRNIVHNYDIIKYKKYVGFKKIDINLALTCYHIFKNLSVDLKYFNVGLLVGIKNNRFRNNYSIVILQLKVQKDFMKILKNIRTERKKNSYFVFGVYDLINYTINIQKKIKTQLHLQFTNIYSNHKNDKINQKYWNNSYLIINNSSCNFYVSCIYNDYFKKTFINIQYNTPDIDENKFKEKFEFP